MSNGPGSRKSFTQARGRQRRQDLLDAAKKLLETQSMQDISLGDIAGEAGIPTGSAYHFFANVGAVYFALAETYSNELNEVLAQPYTINPNDGWLQIVDQAIERGSEFHKHSSAYQQIVTGPKVNPDIKLQDRQNDKVIGKLLIDAVSAAYELPTTPRAREIFFHAVEIIDLFFMLSRLRHSCVTAEMKLEASRAARAYLLIHYPKVLPRHDADA